MSRRSWRVDWPLRPVLLAALLVLFCTAPAVAQTRLVPVTVEQPAGAEMLRQLRAGGLVLFFRHADTRGEPCDRRFVAEDRAGQRNLSAAGQEQSRRIGAQIAELGIPVTRPVLAGPVFRARDTAVLAFGAADVNVVDGLLADDFAGPRLAWVLAEHRRLFSDTVPRGTNRVLVGHRTPAMMVAGDPVAGRAFPEGAALVIEPRGYGFQVIGILMLAPIEGGGFHDCN